MENPLNDLTVWVATGTHAAVFRSPSAAAYAVSKDAVGTVRVKNDEEGVAVIRWKEHGRWRTMRLVERAVR